VLRLNTGEYKTISPTKPKSRRLKRIGLVYLLPGRYNHIRDSTGQALLLNLEAPAPLIMLPLVLDANSDGWPCAWMTPIESQSIDAPS
jgi:hypothetical protein